MKKLAIPVGGLFVALMLAAGCGDDSGGNCIPNDHTQCIQGITYWMDTCGNQGLVAEVCDCGCLAPDYASCDQSCSCQPDCVGKDCGDDGCGGSCGECTGTGEVCTTAGECIVCTPDCTGMECGDDGCQGSCGECSGTETCNASGQCESCTPDCTGLECGDDGCGGSCGVCQPDEDCSPAQLCEVTLSDTLLFTNCTVPYVLDADMVSDQMYMVSHFGDLVQQYCITGGFDGNDINIYPEKMYYGGHDSGNTLSLVQLSMGPSPTLNPEWSVKVEFIPDTDVTTGSTWTAGVAGLNPPEAIVALIRHLGTQNICLKAIGTAGNITFSATNNVTAQEGGSFTLSGQVGLSNPWDLSDYCSNMPPNMPCCP